MRYLLVKNNQYDIKRYPEHMFEEGFLDAVEAYLDDWFAVEKEYNGYDIDDIELELIEYARYSGYDNDMVEYSVIYE